MRPQYCLTRSKEPVPHLGETLTRMPHIRIPCLALDETGQHALHAADADILRAGLDA